MRIEICGGIASGKSTFAAAAQAHFANCQAVHENVAGNCFLTDFYSDPQYYAFETEILFLIQHTHQIKAARKSQSGSVLVCDYSLEQDYAYAESNLAAGEWNCFQQVYHEAMKRIQEADLILFLDCPVDLLLKRIALRGIRNEQGIDAAYLTQTVQRLQERLTHIAAPVVSIQSAEYDFRNPDDFSRIFTEPLARFQTLFQ